MAVLDTTYGQLVIKDTSHAIDKDTRTLFASDNRKNDKRKPKISEIPELRLLSYYGDITGPKELRLRRHCMELIHTKLKKMHFTTVPVSSNYKQHQSQTDISVDTATMQTIFNSIQITHISHYSFEFVVNISTTSLLDEYKTENNTTKSNCYLVSTYQRSEFDNHRNEFVTLGITSAVSNNDYEDRKNKELYNFYVDDFLQDLYVILFNTSWYDDTCHLPSLLWYTIAQFTMDCLSPVPFTRSLADEVVLNDGALRVYLTGELSPRNVIREPESGDSKTNNDDDDDDDEDEPLPLRMDPKLEIIGKVMVEMGRTVHREYHSLNNAKKLKSEYDKWKNKGFKKRALLKPINMKDLRSKLQKHQIKRDEARDPKSVNDLKYIYYKNPNFQLKKMKQMKPPKASHQHFQTAQPSAMKSFMNFFSFKNKPEVSLPGLGEPRHLGHRRSLSTGAVPSALATARIERHKSLKSIREKVKKKKKKAKPKKKEKKGHKSALTEWDADANYNWSNDDYGTSYITTSSQFITSSSTQPAGWQAAASVPTAAKKSPEPLLRASSTGKAKKRRVPVTNRKKKYTHPRTDHEHRFISMDMLLEDVDSNGMDVNDEEYDLDGGATVLAESHSDKLMRLNRPGSPRLQPTMNKPARAKSAETGGSDTSNTSPYAHDDNEMLYMDAYHKSNTKHDVKATGTGRRDSMTTVKLKNDIRKAYKDYAEDKGHPPKDIQAFVSYCKRKNIKKAKWTLCKEILSECANGKGMHSMLQSDTIVE